jgi:ATP-dependent RNA helicase DBP3
MIFACALPATSYRSKQVMPDGRVKDAALEALLKTHHSDGARVIVFCLYKKEAERVEQTLLRKGWKCVSLHGDKSQSERTRAFNAFRDKECNLLVATDVAARGVDLPNVEHVINYTFPLTIEDYVHRIGRTGRGDSVGNSWTFFTTADKAHAGALVNVLQTAKQEVPKDMFQFSLATKRKGGAQFLLSHCPLLTPLQSTQRTACSGPRMTYKGALAPRSRSTTATDLVVKRVV